MLESPLEDTIEKIKAYAIEQFYHKIDLVCWASISVGFLSSIQMIQRNPTILQPWKPSKITPMFLACEITCGKVTETIEFVV